MPIVVLVVVLVAYAWAMIAYPGFRRAGALVGIAVTVALAAYFVMNEPEDTVAGRRIAPEELEIYEVTIQRTIRGATMSGRVLNRSSEYRLRDMTLSLRLRECGAGRESECPVIAEATAIARPEAPPGQLRPFSATFLYDSLPFPSETQHWEWSVIAVRATP